MISFLECTHAEREGERERESVCVCVCVDRTYRWGKFRFQLLSQRSEEGRERLEVREAWSGEAQRSVPTGLERTDRVFPAVFF